MRVSHASQQRPLVHIHETDYERLRTVLIRMREQEKNEVMENTSDRRDMSVERETARPRLALQMLLCQDREEQ